MKWGGFDIIVDFDLEEFVFCAANERDMFRTAAPKFLETDWIDESLRDVASMFPDDGDMFRTAASTDGSGGFVHSRLQLAQLR